MYRNIDPNIPRLPPLATSYTTLFYLRSGFSTIRNSSSLELLVYLLAIEWSVPESLYFHVHTGYDVPWHPASDAYLDLFILNDPHLDRQWKLSTGRIEYAIKCCQSMFFAEAFWRFCGLDFSVWTSWAGPFNAVAVRV